MSKSLKRVTRALLDAGLEPDIREMADSTRTAAEAAAAVGCELDQIVKSIIFAGTESGTIHLFLTAGGNQVDPAKATQAAGEPLRPRRCRRDTRQNRLCDRRRRPPSATSPLPRHISIRDLSDFIEIWAAAAGTPRHVFAISPAKLLHLTGAQPTDFTS